MNLKKFGAGLIANVSIKLLAVGAGFYTTRWIVSNLSKTQYEQYNLVLAYTAIINSVVGLGIPQLIQKFYTNKHTAEEIAPFWTSFSFLRFSSFFMGLLIILVTYPISQTNNLGLIMGVYTIQFILLFDINYRSICDAKGYAWKFSLTDFGNKLILVSLLIAYPILKPDVSALFYFVAVSGIAYTIGLLTDSFIHRKLTPLGKVDFELLRRNFKPIIYISLAFIILGIYTTTDKLFLKYFGYSADTINGYANAYKLFETAIIVPALTAPTIASIAKNHLDDKKVTKFGSKIQSWFHGKSNKAKQQFGTNRAIIFEWSLFTLFIGLISSVGVWLFGSIAINLIDSSNKYPLAYEILPILGITLIPISLLFFYGNLVIFKDGEKETFIGQILVLILGLLLYVILIPKYGAYGAAIATVLTYTADFLTKVVQLRILFKRNRK